jgi:hypothetical protein
MCSFMEAAYFVQVVRCITAILLVGPVLDASYQAFLPGRQGPRHIATHRKPFENDLRKGSFGRMVGSNGRSSNFREPRVLIGRIRYGG